MSNSNIKEPEAFPSVTTKYYVIATLGVCTKMDSFLIKVDPAPIASAGNNVEICSGQNTQLYATGGISFLWAPIYYLSNAGDAAPQVIKPVSTITYQVIATDGNGCHSLNNATVKITVLPPPLVFAGNDTSVVLNQPFHLFAKDINNTGFTAYTWTPSEGLNDIHSKSPVANINRDITYTVTAATPVGCEGSDQITIRAYRGPEIYVPSAFTPNGDGRNDILHAIPVGVRQFKNFAIYNRSGLLMFSTNDATKGWDGKYKQVMQEGGVYVWIAQGTDAAGKLIFRKGTVLLVH